jgi:hypothetical protein
MAADEVTILRLRLLELGYSPIPLFGKEPPIYGKNNKRKGLSSWQQLDTVTPEQIRMWGKTWPDAINTGVLCRHVPTLDLDLLNEKAVRTIEDHVHERYDERGYVLARRGKPPKLAIPFRTIEPFAKIVANVIAPNGNVEKIEFLGDGQQVVVAGIHPDTGRPYGWHGGEFCQIARDDLPYIREAEAQALVDDIVALLVRDFGYKRAAERPGRKARQANGADTAARDQGGSDDWQHLITSIQAGQALHDSLRDLAAKMIASGMNAGAAVNALRALMDGATCPHDERWRERRNDIPRLIDSAETKFREAPTSAPDPQSLAAVHELFQKWLGQDYDLDVLDAVLAAAASERLTGDPLWLLVISGPGNAKTETVQALAGAGAHVTSTIASEGALLSATSRRDKGKNATGGLLRKIGDRGVLVIKDVTSILSADRNVRGPVLAAIREIYDGRWERNVGTDGGKTLTWLGRLVIVGAVTTAWDAAHSVVAAMGDRFVVIRADSNKARGKSATKAIGNTGREIAMRQELAQAAGAIIGNASTDEYQFTEDETEQLVKAANIVTLARTAVERDYRGDVIDAHAPEMPTRFAKQLAQMVRGAIAIGMAVTDAMRLALRCARDSVPPLRREILLDLAAHPWSEPKDVRKRIERPRTTVRRELEALHMLRLLHCDEEEKTGSDGKKRTTLHYGFADDVHEQTLQAMVK